MYKNHCNEFTNITNTKLHEMTNYNKTNMGHQKFVWRRIFLQEELSQALFTRTRGSIHRGSALTASLKKISVYTSRGSSVAW